MLSRVGPWLRESVMVDSSVGVWAVPLRVSRCSLERMRAFSLSTGS